MPPISSIRSSNDRSAAGARRDEADECVDKVSTRSSASSSDMVGSALHIYIGGHVRLRADGSEPEAAAGEPAAGHDGAGR